MDNGYRWLESVARRMRKEIDSGAAASPLSLTVRDLLGKFYYQKRGDWINSYIRNGLEKFNLRTDQDFTVAWLGTGEDLKSTGCILEVHGSVAEIAGRGRPRGEERRSGWKRRQAT